MTWREAVRPENATDLQGKEAWPRYQLALRLDPAAGQLWGHERLRVTNTEDRPLDRIVLRLVPNFPSSFMDDQALEGAARLRVGAVQLDDAPVAATYADANTSLIVPLASPLAQGRERRRHVRFRPGSAEPEPGPRCLVFPVVLPAAGRL